jgi:hypothetical protein
MILVFGLIVLLCIILGIVLWVAHVHNSSPMNGA